MSVPATSRFVMTVKGIPRVLLSVREKDNGRLIITIQGAGNKLRDLGIPLDQLGISANHNVRIAHQKFSVHPSTLSAEHNQLHFQQISADGMKKDKYHVTRAITSNRFAPLFAKRYSNLNDSTYDLKKGANVTNLGNYDTGKFTLIVYALVAHRDCVFTEKSYDFSCIQPQFRIFRLVILWTFFILPPTDYSMLIAPVTLRPEEAANEEDRKFRERLMAGYNVQEAVQEFGRLRNTLREEGIETAFRFAPEGFAAFPSMLRVARFRYFRSGEYTPKVIKALRARFPSGV